MWLIFVLLGGIPKVLLATYIHGCIVGVSDGDTVKWLGAPKGLHTVQVKGIVAPKIWSALKAVNV